MTQLTQWNKTYGIAGHISFANGKGGLPVVTIENSLGKAAIALQGAHVLGFQATGEQALIWMSDDAVFAKGKALRGGIPICWPWFGPHPSDPSLPAHGVARTGDWIPIASASCNDGGTQISFELIQSASMQQLCPHPLSLRLHVTVGNSLRLELETNNLGDTTFTLGQALHTYFQVGDIRQAHIEGFGGCHYLDKASGALLHQQQKGAIHIASEVDRIYLNTGNCCEIIDPSMQRRTIVRSEGSSSTVVWNPWIDIALKMGDLGQDGYLNMLCVETTNAADDVIPLAAGATHCLTAEYSSLPL